MPLCTLIRKECFQRIGLLNRRISSIDDWDIFTRIAEFYEVVVIEEPVGIYRQPTPFSGQGSSARAAQLGRVARHQLELFGLPRAASASAARRREARTRTINRISENLIWTAAKKYLPQGKLVPACANIAVALQLDPMSFIRPGAYLKLAKNLIGDKRRRIVPEPASSLPPTCPRCCRARSGARASGREIRSWWLTMLLQRDRGYLSQNSGIKYVRVDRNQGVAGARNIGLVASSGEFVTFLDDDDLRVSGSLDGQIRILDQTPEAMIYRRAIPEDAGGKRRQPYPSNVRRRHFGSF
jgi:hypothetical protein